MVLTITLKLFGEVAALCLMAYALAVMSRTVGVYILEIVALGTCLALVLAEVEGTPSGGNFSRPDFLAWGLVALVLAFLMPILYRMFRNARGGEATSLIISFSLMNALILGCSKASEGKVLALEPGDLATSTPLLLGSWTLIFVCRLIEKNSRLAAMLWLSRDNEKLLGTFGLDARLLRTLTILSGAAVFLGGVFFYLGRQDHFGVGAYEGFLIPVFGIAICQSTPRIWWTLGLAFVIVSADFALSLVGEPVLHRVYQSVTLVLLVVIARRSTWFDRLRLARIAESVDRQEVI